MGKEKNAVAAPMWRELFLFGVYKRTQGRIARQVTFGALAIVAALGCYRLSQLDVWDSLAAQVTVPTIVWVVICWVAYRLVNMPSFADFLIGVEAEMNKVSWPTSTELYRSVVVVIFSILFLSALIFVYDVVIRFVKEAFDTVVGWVA